MEKLKSTINHALNETVKKECPEIYYILANVQVPVTLRSEFVEEIIPRLIQCCDENILLKEVVYLSFLANEDPEVMNCLSDYEKKNLRVDLHEKYTLFDYCHYNSCHWFLAVLENTAKNVRETFDDDIINKINIFRLIVETNKPNQVRRERIKELLSEIKQTNEKFLQIYVEEVRQCVRIAEFVSNLRGEIRDDSVFTCFLQNRSLLDSLSLNVDLRPQNNYKPIKELLTERETFIREVYESVFPRRKQDMNKYNMLVVIKCVLQAMQFYLEALKTSSDKKKAYDLLDDAKETIFQFTSVGMMVESLENIFAMLFIKNSQVKRTLPHLFEEYPNIQVPDDDTFYCTSRELLDLMIYFLYTISDEIEEKELIRKSGAEYKRFINLRDITYDASWRLEMAAVCKQSSHKIKERNMITYMLAEPESLINICLRYGQFQKADEVFHVFKMTDSKLAKQVESTITWGKIRDSMIENLPSQQSEAGSSTLSEVFSKFQDLDVDEDIENFLEQNMMEHPVLKHYRNCNGFLNLLDVALTCSQAFINSIAMLHSINEHYQLDSKLSTPLSIFCYKIQELFSIVKDKTIPDILADPEYDLDLVCHKKERNLLNEMHEQLGQFMDHLKIERAGKLNHVHESHSSFYKLQELCVEYAKWKKYLTTDTYPKYFIRTINYLKCYSRIFEKRQDITKIVSHGMDVPYFSIFNVSRSNVIGTLVFDKSNKPSEFERLYRHLKLDMGYEMAANSFPIVPLRSIQNISIEYKSFSNLKKPKEHLIDYIGYSSPIIGYALKEIYKVGSFYPLLIKLKYLENFIKAPFVSDLSPLFGNNLAMTAFSESNHIMWLLAHCNNLDGIDSLRNTAEGTGDDVEAAEEIDESLRVTDWQHNFRFFLALPNNVILSNDKVTRARDSILFNIVVDRTAHNYHKYVQFIWDDKLRVNIILREMKYWPANFCLDVIADNLSNPTIEKSQKGILMEWYLLMELHVKLTPLFPEVRWFDIHNMCQRNYPLVIEAIMKSAKVDMMLQYILLYDPSEQLLEKVDYKYLEKLLLNEIDLQQFEKLLTKLPFEHLAQQVDILLSLVHKLDQLKFLSNFLLQLTNKETQQLRILQVSFKIQECLHTAEQDLLWGVIFEPLSMLEVLIMNTRLDKLANVLENLKPELQNNFQSRKILSMEKIDALLRTYAEKSLECRIITNPNPNRNQVDSLLVSFDSSIASSSFNIPEQVPSRDQWVADADVLECMCCETTTFSMFNRRHHCRRCGRVVCFNCSSKRMPVESYGTVLVRVCRDCYVAPKPEDIHPNVSDASMKTNQYDFWCLSDDKEENDIVRREFSYEHAPSASLCLAIMRHHSKCVEYPEFLLTQCKKILKMIKPVGSGTNREIDYSLTIKMIKSLAFAAKIQSFEFDHPKGVASAEEILRQADIYLLLTQKDQLSLLSNTITDHITTTTIRKLRDKLLDAEEWNLALEVSTKGGLSTSSVFAAWAKSNLRAGRFRQAREKFIFCFSKLKGSNQSPVPVSFYPTSQVESSNSAPVLNGKPEEDPPLLKEILKILESMDKTILRENILTEFGDLDIEGTPFVERLNRNLALCITNKLRNLTTIETNGMAGYPDEQKIQLQSSSGHVVIPKMETIIYEESLYYLKLYGSHKSLIQFYFKHSRYEEGLQYFLNKNLCSEIFCQLYFDHLKEGTIEILQVNMLLAQPSLNFWKKHLQVVSKKMRNQSLWHSLYQFQIFIKDYLRCCLSSLKFYTENIKSLSELDANRSYIQDAIHHMTKALDTVCVEQPDVSFPPLAPAQIDIRCLKTSDFILRIPSHAAWRLLRAIEIQYEASTTLGQFEKERPDLLSVIETVVSYDPNDRSEDFKREPIPVVYTSTLEKIQVAVLLLVGTKEVKKTYPLVHRLINDTGVRPAKVYVQVGLIYINEGRFNDVFLLVESIDKSSYEKQLKKDCIDEVLYNVSKACWAADPQLRKEFFKFVSLIKDAKLKVDLYINAGQLRTAYLFAVRDRRLSDVRRILKLCRECGMHSLRNVCERALESEGEPLEEITIEQISAQAEPEEAAGVSEEAEENQQ